MHENIQILLTIVIISLFCQNLLPVGHVQAQAALEIPASEPSVSEDIAITETEITESIPSYEVLEPESSETVPPIPESEAINEIPPLVPPEFSVSPLSLALQEIKRTQEDIAFQEDLYGIQDQPLYRLVELKNGGYIIYLVDPFINI